MHFNLFCNFRSLAGKGGRSKGGGPPPWFGNAMVKYFARRSNSRTLPYLRIFITSSQNRVKKNLRPKGTFLDGPAPATTEGEWQRAATKQWQRDEKETVAVLHTVKSNRAPGTRGHVNILLWGSQTLAFPKNNTFKYGRSKNKKQLQGTTDKH